MNYSCEKITRRINHAQQINVQDFGIIFACLAFQVITAAFNRGISQQLDTQNRHCFDKCQRNKSFVDLEYKNQVNNIRRTHTLTRHNTNKSFNLSGHFYDTLHACECMCQHALLDSRPFSIYSALIIIYRCARKETKLRRGQTSHLSSSTQSSGCRFISLVTSPRQDEDYLPPSICIVYLRQIHYFISRHSQIYVYTCR